MSTVLKARVTAFTHQGAVRTQNEDTIAVGSWVRNAPMENPRQIVHGLDVPLLCLIADGMGGHAAGNEASRLAAFRLAAASPAISDEAGISALLRETNREFFDVMRGDPQRLGMGTTVVGILLREEGSLWFNVGDSRLYRYRDHFLRQLSIDDVLDPYATNRRHSTTVTQTLGGAQTFLEVAPHIGTEPFVPGWRYLLCSDGLTEMLTIEAIEAAVSEDDAATVTALFEQAMATGGEDNISIILVRIEERSDHQKKAVEGSNDANDAV